MGLVELKEHDNHKCKGDYSLDDQNGEIDHAVLNMNKHDA